ncbi:NAD-dependent epimerase/dehydratase family protein [Flavobacteriaceae bacterium]|nr:NAD-dependent epimerase/dehydratase family protein [Flavobacteriaceae bacterium]
MQEKKLNNVLVIGGSGFVGSFLIRDLIDEYQVKNMDKNKSPFFNNISSISNILNKQDLKFDKNIDSIVLLAAEHRDDISPNTLYYDVNVQGTKNVLEAMDSSGIKNLVFTSSVAVYGLNKLNPDENHIQDPFNHYGKSKWEAELAIKEWYENDPKNKSITILRPTVIFGERNRGNVFNLLKQISSGRFMMIGKGVNKKSMAYVGNIVALIKSRLETCEQGYHVFNYADKPDFSMTELTQLIEKKMNIKIPNLKIPYLFGIFIGYTLDLISIVSGKKFALSSVRIKKFCATTQFNATKVHNKFNAPYSLREGLDRTLEHEFINKKEDEVLFYSE